MPDGRGHFLASWLGCPAKLVSFRYNRNRNRKKFRNYPKQKVCLGFFGIYRNWNVLILSVVSVQPKKNRKTERRGKGGRRKREGGGHFVFEIPKQTETNRKRWLYSFGKNTETEPKLSVFSVCFGSNRKKKNPFRRTPYSWPLVKYPSEPVFVQ
jgi:hypothetical protein